MIPGMTGPQASVGRRPAELVFVNSYANGGNATNYTFTDSQLGDPAPDRLVVVTVNSYGNTSIGINAVKIDGVAMDQVIEDPQGEINTAAIFSMVVPAGTTGDIRVEHSTDIGGCCVGVYALYGLQDTNAFDVQADGGTPFDVDIAVPEGGIVIAVATNELPNAVFWTGVTEDYDRNLESGVERGAAASASGLSAQTLNVTVNSAGGDINLVAASWA